MDYRVQWTRRAQKIRAGLALPIAKAMREAAGALGNNPRPPGVKKLHGELEGQWRIRVRRNYRLIYEIDDAGRVVTIVNLGHRGSTY